MGRCEYCGKIGNTSTTKGIAFCRACFIHTLIVRKDFNRSEAESYFNRIGNNNATQRAKEFIDTYICTTERVEGADNIISGERFAHTNSSEDANPVGVALKVIGAVLGGIAVFVGLLMFVFGIEYEGTATMGFIIALGGGMGGTLIFAFGEVVNLLQDIKNK